MRCKKHPIDLSSSASVCASCLRERLFALVAAQTPSHAQPYVQYPAHPQTEPLVFPRSVSPYENKPDQPEFPNKNLLRRFHGTPQARHDSTVGVAPAKKHQKFSLLSHLFRSRSEKFSSDCEDASSRCVHGVSISSQADSIRTSTSSPSWLPSFRGRLRAPSTRSSLEDSGHASHWKPFWVPDRGMSPPEFQEGSPSGSESSPQGRWRTSASGLAPARRSRPLAHSNNVHGMGLCLNPFVRASPSRDWKQKKGEVRTPAQPHISKAPASGANRSKKLTLFGRTNKNRWEWLKIRKNKDRWFCLRWYVDLAQLANCPTLILFLQMKILLEIERK